METENQKPQTGGLRLMTVFVAVLALHVLVIGGISVWHLFSGAAEPSDAMAKSTTTTTTADKVAATDDATAKPAVATNTTTPNPTDPASAQMTMPTASTTAATATASEALAQTPAPLDEMAPTTAAAFTGRLAPGQLVPDLAAAPAVGASAPAAVYIVRSGDTLSRIARRQGTTIHDLRQANGLKSDALRIGQTLKVPAANRSTAGAPAVKMTKTAPTAVAMTEKAPAGSSMYTVAPRDTLTKIARQFKTTPAAIMTANQISDPHRLKVGMRLVIPTSSVAVQAAPVAPAPTAAIMTASQ